MDQAITLTREDSGRGDEALLIQAARDDPAAFAPLYYRYRDRVYAYVRTRTNNGDDAFDLTQQVFLQALDALPRYRGRREVFAAWLFRIARNAVTDHYRRRRGAVTWDLVPPALQPVAAQNLEAEILREDAMAELGALLRDLDTETRELLALRYGARLTVGQIAAVIGKSEAATRKRLARTLHALAAHFDGARR